MADFLDPLLESARCVVCVGPGGVGKTSTSAAIAMQAARLGKRTIVLTIDPARRLANALGLPEIGNEEAEVGERAFAAVGLPKPKGRLTAMMLDIKRTWDDVINRYHPDPERRTKLLANRLYVALSTALAGSQEYMAMEKLYELAVRTEDPLDAIILDTPPANHAVDFLEAPSRMLNALDNDATKWLVEPYKERGRITQKLFDAGSSFFIRTISRFTGAELLDELAELLVGFQGMYEGFRARARATREILEAEDTQFLVVSKPEDRTVVEAGVFRDRLVERGCRVGGIVLNRATFDPFRGATPDPTAFEQELLAANGSSDLSRRLSAVAEAARRAAAKHAAAARMLADRVEGIPVTLVPELPRDVHDLVGLEALRTHMFARG
jgi:anion-transporting  ArsA/GET3 family ATPase